MKQRLFMLLMSIGLFSILSIVGNTVEATDLPETRLDLNQLITIAFKENPRLRRARLQWQATIERYPQVTALDDPIFQVGHFIESVETRVGPQERQYSIVQKFPFPGKLAAKGAIVSKAVAIAKVKLERESRAVITDLKDAYYELLYSEQAIELTKQNQDIVAHLARIATTDYAVDGTTLNDVFKAESQEAQLAYDLVLLNEFRDTQRTRINATLNRPPESPLGKPAQMPYQTISQSIEDFYRLGSAAQENLKIAQLKIDIGEKEIALAKLKSRPNFQLGMSYVEVGEALINTRESGRDAYKLNFGLTLPLWFEKNRARLQEAELERKAAVFHKEALEKQLFTQIKMAYFKLKNAERLVQLYQHSLIPQAQQSIEIAETWYKEKQGSFTGLLEAQSVWLNFNLALQRALTNVQQSVAKLEKLTGTTLQVKPWEVKP